MTIQSETRLSGPYTGTGLVTVYPFTFKVFQASDLLVIQTDTSGTNTTLALTSNYTVSLNPDQNSNPGGSITLVAALPASYTLVISSQIPYQQTLDILNNQTWYPQVIEDALDRLTILIQQVKQSLGNALQLPLSSSGVSTTLPNPVASNFLGWNSAANAIINYAGVASAAVSTYMSGFVSLTSAAAARAYIAAVGLADTNVWTATNTFTDTLFRILKNGSAFYARILAPNLTANRDITLPDKNGTMAMISDIPSLPLSIANGGTGQTTALSAVTALLGSQNLATTGSVTIGGVRINWGTGAASSLGIGTTNDTRNFQTAFSGTPYVGLSVTNNQTGGSLDTNLLVTVLSATQITTTIVTKNALTTFTYNWIVIGPA